MARNISTLFTLLMLLALAFHFFSVPKGYSQPVASCEAVVQIKVQLPPYTNEELELLRELCLDPCDCSMDCQSKIPTEQSQVETLDLYIRNADEYDLSDEDLSSILDGLHRLDVNYEAEDSISIDIDRDGGDWVIELSTL